MHFETELVDIKIVGFLLVCHKKTGVGNFSDHKINLWIEATQDKSHTFIENCFIDRTYKFRYNNVEQISLVAPLTVFVSGVQDCDSTVEHNRFLS